MAIRNWASTLLGVLGLWIVAFPVQSAPGPAHVTKSAVDETYVRLQDSPLRDVLARVFGNGQFNKSYALVIGVGDYDDANKLDAPAKDALRVRDFLKNEAGFDYIVTLTDAAANQARIVKLMETTFPRLLKSNDRFLFYFSGHGLTRPLSSGPRGYLLLKASHKDNFDEMIGMPDIHRWAENLGDTRHVLFVLDACFSGLAAFQPKAIDSRDVTIQRLSQPSSYLLTAGVDQEESYAYNGASLFTQAFLATARGQINPPPDGIVSLDDLISGINRLLDARRKQLGIKMTPHLYQERIERNEGQFFFLPSSMQHAVVANTALPTFPGKKAAPVTPGPGAAPQAKSPSVIAPQNSPLASLNPPTRGGSSVSPNNFGSRQPSGSRGPNEELRDCQECPEMVAIKPGTFQMGAPASEEKRLFANEGPIHEVRINYAFSVSKYPITRAEWKQFVSARAHMDNSDCLQAQQDDHPVVCVSWQDANDYAAWLTKISGGHHYRLLSEAEYEYVNRAGTTTVYWWGDSFSSSQANGNGVTTTKVGSYEANPWGLFDTTGNVYSWVLDCWHVSYKQAPNDGSTWGGGDCSKHVVRGGAWDGSPEWLRSAYRDRGAWGINVIGFRVARDVE